MGEKHEILLEDISQPDKQKYIPTLPKLMFDGNHQFQYKLKIHTHRYREMNTFALVTIRMCIHTQALEQLTPQ